MGVSYSLTGMSNTWIHLSQILGYKISKMGIGKWTFYMSPNFVKTYYVCLSSTFMHYLHIFVYMYIIELSLCIYIFISLMGQRLKVKHVPKKKKTKNQTPIKIKANNIFVKKALSQNSTQNRD